MLKYDFSILKTYETSILLPHSIIVEKMVRTFVVNFGGKMGKLLNLAANDHLEKLFVEWKANVLAKIPHFYNMRAQYERIYHKYFFNIFQL